MNPCSGVEIQVNRPESKEKGKIMADATAKEVKEFFGYKNVSEFSKDWKALSEESQQQLKSGIGNGTFTY